MGKKINMLVFRIIVRKEDSLGHLNVSYYNFFDPLWLATMGTLV